MIQTTASLAKILVVEDEQVLRDLYVGLLTKEGYMVEAAIDGEEAYMKMHAGGYDLVLLDIMLPKISGVDVLKRLKNEIPPDKPNKKIILLTNLGYDTIVAEAVALGVRSYILKSDYTPDRLLEEIESALRENDE